MMLVLENGFMSLSNVNRGSWVVQNGIMVILLGLAFEIET